MIGVGLLTYNQFQTGRDELFLRTLESITRESYPHRLSVVTNGSTDGTERVVRRLGGVVDNTHPAVWYGMELAIGQAALGNPDIIVFSADDVVYTPGWMDRLAAFWEAAPDDVVLATLFVEGLWNWNPVLDAVDLGGERALIRASIPGASLSFRAHDLPKILPLERIMPGEDLALCRKLRAQGYRLAALDLADHAGREISAWGNRSFEYEQPLDRQKWGL